MFNVVVHWWNSLVPVLSDVTAVINSQSVSAGVLFRVYSWIRTSVPQINSRSTAYWLISTQLRTVTFQVPSWEPWLCAAVGVFSGVFRFHVPESFILYILIVVLMYRKHHQDFWTSFYLEILDSPRVFMAHTSVSWLLIPSVLDSECLQCLLRVLQFCFSLTSSVCNCNFAVFSLFCVSVVYFCYPCIGYDPVIDSVTLTLNILCTEV